MKKLDWLPNSVRDPLVSLKNSYHQVTRQRALRRAVQDQPAKKIVVGACDTQFDGWVSSDKKTLNLLAESDWVACFEPGSLNAILAEHVWEHLTPEEAGIAATYCFRFLKPGGYLRVAVPDGFHPDPGYIEWVRPEGSGPGADDHKVLYTYDTFRKVFTSAGFNVSMYEYYDEHGEFHGMDWNHEEGMIRRSRRFDEDTFDRRKSGVSFAFTSIILDAIKPTGCRN